MSYMACDVLQRIKKSLMHIVAFSRDFFFSDQFRVNIIATSKIWGFLMQRTCCYNKQLVIFKTNITYMGNIYQKPTVYIKKRKIVIEKIMIYFESVRKCSVSHGVLLLLSLICFQFCVLD